MRVPHGPWRRAAPALLLALLFAWTVFRFDDLAALLAPIASGKRLFVEREPLYQLALQHLVLTATTCTAAFAIAFPLGLLISRGEAHALGEFADKAASFGETFPPVALMALLIPFSGYGFAPVAIALVAWSILPILRNTVAGLAGASAETIDAAWGCGMSETQVLTRIRLPLALPLVIQGLRVSLVTNIATATLGAVVGAGGFGVPIVSGIRSFDPLLILKGSIPVALLALFCDATLRAVEESLAARP